MLNVLKMNYNPLRLDCITWKKQWNEYWILCWVCPLSRHIYTLTLYICPAALELSRLLLNKLINRFPPFLLLTEFFLTVGNIYNNYGPKIRLETDFRPLKINTTPNRGSNTRNTHLKHASNEL
jgi:hypothetical protein